MERSCGDTLGIGDEFTVAAAGATSRRGFLRRSGIVGAAVATAGVFAAGDAAAAPLRSQALDLKIFNWALLLEYMQAAFYAESLDRARLRGEIREFAETVGGHEREHVAYLRKALGAQAHQRPTFHFGPATSNQRKFLDAAVQLENIGVAAYNGQAANLTKPALSAAVEIVSVEGRHAAWVSDLAGRQPAPRAADPGESAQQINAALRATGWTKR
jgi:hypothetical protein